MKITGNNDWEDSFDKEGIKTKQEAQLRIFAAQAMNASGQFQNFLETAIDEIVGDSGVGASSYASSDSSSLDSIFDRASDKYNVDKQLLLAVARTESNFKPKATSPHGAMGVMQLMPDTAKALGVKDAYDPFQNIMGGAKLLRMLLDKYNDNRSKALAAYNAGSNAVDSYGGVPPENEGYVRTVLGYYAEGVQSPDADNNLTYTSGNHRNAADELKSAFSKFPEHQTYEAFLDELSSEMRDVEDPGDANQAYRTLLLSAKSAIDRVKMNLLNETDSDADDDAYDYDEEDENEDEDFDIFRG